jgi:hypothetical protein
MMLEYNHRATIVKEIAHIHFTALLGLNLACNSIESVEGLAHIHIPKLQKLVLCTWVDNTGVNNITQVGVMGKAAWRAL